jgi:hypothetical protein
VAPSQFGFRSFRFGARKPSGRTVLVAAARGAKVIDLF